MAKRIPATYISVWDNGVEVESPAMFDRDSGLLTDVQMAPLPEGVLNSLEVLTGEYVRYDGRQYALRDNKDGTYNAIRPYGVFFARHAYAQVMATSADEAMRIADEKLTYDELSWDDSWSVTDALLED